MSMSFEPRISTFFFTSVLPTLFTKLRALSVDVNSRLNVILTVFGIITITMYFNVSMLTCTCVCYVWHIDPSDMFVLFCL